MTSFRVAGLSALAMLLVLSACAQAEVGEDTYEFPAELVALDEVATGFDDVATENVAPAIVSRLSAEPEPVEAAPPQVVVEALEANARPLPLPTSALLPEIGRIEPSVIGADGERRLLKEVLVSVSYEPESGVVVDPAGWWVVNYPLDRIVGAPGQTVDAVSRVLLGQAAADVTNYYFYTAPASGEDVPELPPATGPAPVGITPGPDLVVDNQHVGASDENEGSVAHPLLTISAAVDRATPGTVVHVYPGVYRESVVVEADGTEDEPIRIEGIRGASGAMPVITGNDPFPVGAWNAVDGLSGVYEAEAFTDLPGSLTANGETLVERSAPWELDAGEYVMTSGSEAYVEPRFDGDLHAAEGSLHTFDQSQYMWEVKPTDGGGFVDLGSEFGEDFAGGVYWGSAWVWVERPSTVGTYEWFGTNDFDLQVSGPFRSGRISGVPFREQPYEYRVWLDGELLAGNVRIDSENGESDLAHPELGRGEIGESWHGVVMREGWHQLVFQWDTTAGGEDPAAPLFRFGVPEIVGEAVTSAAAPSNQREQGQGQPQPYVSEYLVLGPVPADYEPSVYVRLPANADPNDADIDMAARSGPVVEVVGDFVEVRGFEIRHGAQIEGEALVAVGRRTDGSTDDAFAQGVVIEGNLVAGSEYGGISVAVEGDQGVAPIRVRNNWVIDAGAVGIAAQGNSERLTEETLNDWAPGRTTVIVEDNTVVNAGWAGYSRQTDVAGIKFERMTGSSINRNTIVGGGPGITLTAENYGIRIDGNRIIDPWAWGIGVEANPGPNLIANNLITGLRAGPEWAKAHILTWDSDQTWIVNNTTDGEWGIETGWFGDIGSWGAGGPENFNRVEYDTWDMGTFRRVYVNNLLLGSYLGGIEDYQGNWGETDTFEGNFREVPSPDPFDYLADGADRANVRSAFVDRDEGDYRLVPGSDLAAAGTVGRTSKLATHDFYGLPRINDDGASVGAFRSDLPVERGSSVVEVELTDGTIVRTDG